MPRIAFEDFLPGATRILGPVTVSKDEIIAFGREYDAQPFHVDEAAAKESFIGTLIASGWHSCCINMRLLADGLLLDSTSMGAPGIDEVKWLKPVRPGDTLRSRMTVLETRPSNSRPAIGFVRFRFELTNGADEIVVTQANTIMFGRLCASGWQTAAIWMKLLSAHRERPRAWARAQGETPARLGPPPGFTNLKWLKPVYAGDTITYRTTLTGKRPSASRPGWGMATHHNTGVNQNDEEVF